MKRKRRNKLSSSRELRRIAPVLSGMAPSGTRRNYYLARDEVDVLGEVDEVLEALERTLKHSLKGEKLAGILSDFKERLEAIERRLEDPEKWKKKTERTLERALGSRSSR